MKYLYKARFDNIVNASLNFDYNVLLSNASIDSLKSIIPSSVDLNKNIDLIGTAFNAAVVNKFNKNGDGIDTNTALAFKNYFVHKPTNIEHKKARVVGHIVNSAFSSFGENKILSDEEVKNKFDPFNIALAAVVYKTVDRNFADALIKSNDKDSNLYQKISASWEIGFNDYLIAIGSDDLKNAEIISKKEHLEEFKKYLKGFDGPGRLNDGTPVYRLVTGRIYPLGIGFTTNPAADVRGVIIDDGSSLIENSDIDEDENESIEVNSNQILDLFSKKISQDQKPTVNNNKIKTMDLEQIISALRAVLSEQSSDKSLEFSEKSIANISNRIAESIKSKNEEFKSKLQAEEEAKQKAIAEAQALRGEVEKNNSLLSETRAKLTELENTIASQAAQELYNSRMSLLDSEYDFDDADRSILAKEISGLDNSDESFASYKEKVSVLFKHKNKAFKNEQEKVFNEKLEAELAKRLASQNATANVSSSTKTVEIETALANAKVEKQNVPQETIQPTEATASWKEKLSKAFSKENITIKY